MIKMHKHTVNSRKTKINDETYAIYQYDASTRPKKFEKHKITNHDVTKTHAHAHLTFRRTVKGYSGLEHAAVNVNSTRAAQCSNQNKHFAFRNKTIRFEHRKYLIIEKTQKKYEK